MAESLDWKSKYVEAIREMEQQEQQWRGLETALRRLVTRLCAVASGADDRLDLQLGAVAKAVRKDAQTVELQALTDSLSDAVLALDQTGTLRPSQAPKPPPPPTAGIRTSGSVAPIPPSPDRQRPAVPSPAPAAPPPSAPAAPVLRETITAVQGILEHLTVLGDPGLAASCATQLALASDDGALARVIDQVADLVRDRAEAIARDRREAAALLAQVTERLEEMASFLTGSSEASTQAYRDVDSLNTHVLREVAEISAQASAASDLAPLRALVAERLEAVATRVREFRTAQEERFIAHSERIERLRARITELETETTALHRGLAEERQHARTDALTGVANRAAYDERIGEEIGRHQRFGNPVSLLVWDIDLFKRINDDYGHRAGDAVLREVARVLSSRKRATDHLARYGGEEFVMLLVGTGVADAVRVAEQLRESVAALKFGFRGTPLRITVSCGLTELRSGDDPQTAFDRADAALYRAKDAGRNCCLSG